MVMGLDDWGEDPEGATPLGEEEREGLRLSWVTDRSDLNAAEADNIRDGILKWEARRHRLDSLLDDKTVRDLHRDMFGDVWGWAGKYRRRELNIGVEPARVGIEVRNLGHDARFWFGKSSTMPVEEAAARLHHRLVQIHPFPNGNGLLSRELTDLVLISCGEATFRWGRTDLVVASETRSRYIAALRAADAGDIAPILKFLNE
jgi:Fic-DOC domain mobile mystery protein B